MKSEKSRSAVELSGKVVKRGYLLKQVSTAEIGGFELNYRLLICGASGLCVHSPVYLCVRGTR